MQKVSLSMLFSIICFLPSLVVAETEAVKHDWAFGYNNEVGISIHRFINEDWEVYFGGRPFGRDDSYHYVEYDYLPDGSAVLYRDRTEVDESTGGLVRLGLGHTILRDERFWLVAMGGLKYSWSDYDDIDTYLYRDEEGVATRGNVGHWTRATAFIGLRPAYDISSHITFSLEFGVSFYHYSTTTDEWTEDLDNVAYWDTSTTRRSSSTDRVELYGYYGINSIHIMFRF